MLFVALYATAALATAVDGAASSGAGAVEYAEVEYADEPKQASNRIALNLLPQSASEEREFFAKLDLHHSALEADSQVTTEALSAQAMAKIGRASCRERV